MKLLLKKYIFDFIYTGKSVNKSRNKLLSLIENNSSTQIHQKKIYIDLSIICQGDRGTGIQRVVRAIYTSLKENSSNDYRIIPVFATSESNYKKLSEDFNFQFNPKKNGYIGEDIVPNSGDIFFGLDLSSSVLPRWINQLSGWKKAGVKISFIVYDLLPIKNPCWFHTKTTWNFYCWLRSVAIVSDDLFCISNSVRSDLNYWLINKYMINNNMPNTHVITIGGDLRNSIPSLGIPSEAKKIIKEIIDKPTALMVGTLEPRKGYDEIIDAFEYIWKSYSNANYGLTIIGRRGWKNKKLIKKIKKSSYLGSKLIWIEEASDEYLDEIYKVCHGVIAASYDEGFGLPIIEAAAHGKKILVRDIPVFREFNFETISYFDLNMKKSELADKIIGWFNSNITSVQERSEVYTWKKSSAQIINILTNK